MTGGADDGATPDGGQPAAHVHDWQVTGSEEVSNPSHGPSAFGWQTVALLRCAECGDVASRILAGRWGETLKARTMFPDVAPPAEAAAAVVPARKAKP